MIKQVIVIRKDLNMRKGKMIVQGCHASLKVILDMMTENPHPREPEVRFQMDWIRTNSPLYNWITGSFTKICVSVDSEDELMSIYNNAKENEILCALITDNGFTEFHGVPTITCCAIGPDESEKIDKITGHLKLL